MVVCPAGPDGEVAATRWPRSSAWTSRSSTPSSCDQLRRSHGCAANPFRVYPLTIVSLPWLRGAEGAAAADEVLAGRGPDRYPRTFDLLILDEAHHVAPAAPKQRYAVDSQQTKLIRRLAPHFEHRLFLSATPHNGYPESFTALLEMIDNQRFARGVDPDPAAQRGHRGPPAEEPTSSTPTAAAVRGAATRRRSPVDYPDDERQAHALLTEFAALRRKRLTTRRGRAAVDLVTLLLKKRLFSCPAPSRTPSASTWRTAPGQGQEAPRSARRRGAGVDGGLLRRRRRPTTTRSSPRPRTTRSPVGHDPGGADRRLRGGDRAARADGDVGGAARDAARTPRPRELITYLRRSASPTASTGPTSGSWCSPSTATPRSGWRTCCARMVWPATRVAAAATAAWTPERAGAAAAGVPGRPDRAPGPDPARHRRRQRGHRPAEHCHRLVNYDIPFNPNKLEQRIGRIDRYGQQHDPEVRHFVGTGWEQRSRLLRGRPGVPGPGRGEGRPDGGGPRHGQRGAGRRGAAPDARRARRLRRRERRGRREAAAESRRLAADADVSEQVRRLRARPRRDRRGAEDHPGHVKRVVDTALELRGSSRSARIDEQRLAEGLFDVRR